MKHLLLMFAALAFMLTSCGSDAPEATATAGGHSCSKTCSHDHGHEHKGCSHGHGEAKKAGMCSHSCGKKDYDKSKLVEATEAKVGDLTICPMSGSVYQVAEETPKVKHGDKEVHVCCASCAEAYEKNPEKMTL